MSIEDRKREAGYAAVDRYVRDGTCIGLGTGSTARWAIERAGERVRAGADLCAVATSLETERLCRERAIPLVGLLEREIDVAIDGADEVGAGGALTKGGGGALFREKAVALAARRFVVVVTEEKLVERLGAFPTPVEVVPFALRYVEREIEGIRPGAAVRRRRSADGAPFVSDNGNAILDCAFGPIDDPVALAGALLPIHGVVDCGLFVGLTDVVVVAAAGGVRELTFAR
jgi:ribose 5-phosphate isomerase A